MRSVSTIAGLFGLFEKNICWETPKFPFSESRYIPGWVATSEEGFWWSAAPTNLRPVLPEHSAVQEEEDVEYCTATAQVKCLFKGATVWSTGAL